MSNVVDTAKITDGLVKSFVTATDGRLALWRIECINEFTSLCEELGVVAADLRTTRHIVVQKYLDSFFCMIVLRDSGYNGRSDIPADDLYIAKYNLYRQETSSLRERITSAMLTDADGDITPDERVGSTLLWRG